MAEGPHHGSRFPRGTRMNVVLNCGALDNGYEPRQRVINHRCVVESRKHASHRCRETTNVK
eukprot:10282551-Alexandrium_andersonii.AAC.1